MALQAVALTVLSATAGIGAQWLVVPALTVAVAAIAAVLPRGSRTVVAGLTAGALLVQALYAVVAFGGSSGASVLLLAVLCVVALYEVGRVFAATVVAAVASIVVIVVIDPTLIDLPTNASDHLWGVLASSLVAMAVSCGALMALWHEHSRVRHIAAQQRRATEAYLEVAGTMMFVMDRDGIVTVANRHTCLTLDRELDEIVGREWFGLALPPEYRDEARRLYALSFEHYASTGEMYVQPVDYENEVEARDGSRRQVVWWATMVTDRHGQPTGMVCSGTDVTDQRAARAALERSGIELEALRRLAQKIASLDDSRQAVVDATLDLTGAAAVAIFEPDRTGEHLIATTATADAFVGESIQIGHEASIAASAFLSGQPHFLADCAGAPGVNQRLVETYGVEALMHQPIIGGHGSLGVLSVLWTEPVSSQHDRQVELVGLIAHEAAISLRRRESLLQLERAALVDPLTGVANRRAFDAELPLALRRAGAGKYPLGLVVLDLNEFKAVNDYHGHAAGDELLIRAASAWADALRAGDLLARLGGDEFAVLLPSCDEAEMALIIARLKRATPHDPGSSMGGAMWNGVESASSLIRRADRAQYADKDAMRRAAERLSGSAADAGSRVAAPGPAHPRPRGEDPRAVDVDGGQVPPDDRGDGDGAT